MTEYEIDHDEYDRLMGPPPEEPGEEPPVDLDAVEEAFGHLEEELRELAGTCEHGALVAAEIPRIITELREARERQERHAPEAWMQYTVTADARTAPGANPEIITAEQADQVLANTSTPRVVWARRVAPTEQWLTLSAEPPF